MYYTKYLSPFFTKMLLNSIVNLLYQKKYLLEYICSNEIKKKESLSSL